MWIFLLGRTLNECILPRFQLNETMLIVNLFFYIGAYTLITMYSDTGITLLGFAAFIPIFMLFSMLYLYYFAAKALSAAEFGKPKSFGERFGDMMLLLVGIFGIWSIQPRLNVIWEKNKELFSENELDREADDE